MFKSLFGLFHFLVFVLLLFYAFQSSFKQVNLNLFKNLTKNFAFSQSADEPKSQLEP